MKSGTLSASCSRAIPSGGVPLRSSKYKTSECRANTVRFGLFFGKKSSMANATTGTCRLWPGQLANTMWNQSLQLHSPCQLMTCEFKFETPQCQHVRQVALPSEVNRANSLGFQPMHTSISMKDRFHVIALCNLICTWERYSIETIAATDGKRSFMATAANS